MSRIHLAVIALLLAGVVLVLGRRAAPPPDARTAPAVGGLPGEAAVAVTRSEGESLLAEGRPWRAAQAMRRHLDRDPDPSAEAVLLAARAEAGWGGWDRVRALLEGREWLSEQADGEGLFLLARAMEEDGEWTRAAELYRRFLAVRPATDDPTHTVAVLRAGLVGVRTGEAGEGGELLDAARDADPGLSPWIDLLAAEALAQRGDTAAVRSLVAELDGAAVGRRIQRARLAALDAAGDAAGVRTLAERYAGASSGAARSEFALVAARAAQRTGDAAAARGNLRVAAGAAPRSAAAREAATELRRLGGMSAGERLLVARALDAHGQNREAAAEFRAWLGTSAGTPAERRGVQLSLARALFDAGSFDEAERLARALAAGTDATAAEALFLAGRARYRAGDRAGASATYVQVADRFPGSQAGAEALYLAADMAHEDGALARARRSYRRVADDFAGIDRAGLALMRLAGMAYHEGAHAEAARVWGEYRARYPRGQLWQQATYWEARAREEAGDRAAAMALFREARARDATSYYALRAAERSGAAFWPVPMGPEPALAPAAARRVEGWMRTVDLLRAAGLHDEADAETDRLVGRIAGDRDLAYPLAEALNERGYTVRGIRLGLQIQGREGRLNPRLLRILYPFPYREVIEAEAREVGIDPLVSAALIRQESMFSARISSPVGARGLMQVMPQTGREVAADLGIARWNDDLLFEPEINVHLGTRYLADQFRSYDGSLPSVFSAYNAGPHRVDAWKRFPEYGDEELFTERIPFRETRDYVKILTRNIAIYQGLYGNR